MQFGIDYKEIFQDRLVIITGVGRSGTTILGKVLGSMENTYYIFEPAMLKYQVYKDYLDLPILFEDYFLPIIQGRNLNHNPSDDSYCGYYYQHKDIKNAWNTLSRRKKALEYIVEHRPYLIIKSPEFQPLARKLNKIIPSAQFINIKRGLNDTIRSTVNKEWYADDYNSVDYFDQDNIPYFIDPKSRKYWLKWNMYTRAACVWRCLTEYEMPENTIDISYEDLIKNPWRVVENLCVLLGGLKKTIITIRNIKSIKGKTTQYERLLDKIEHPECCHI